MPDVVVEFVPAAFKHGVTEEDIYFVVENFVYNEVLEGDEEKHLFIGFDLHGRLLEIMYNVIDEQSIHVFHAMKCRKAYVSLIKK